MDLQNKVIQITSKEEKSGQFGPIMKIKDEKGMVYSVYKNKKDGTTSVAWEEMPDIGDHVQIAYVEETKQHPDYGKVTYRTVRAFDKDIGNGVANAEANSPADPPIPAKREQPETDQTFWDKKAYKQCLWNYWLTTNREQILGFMEMDFVWQVFNQIEQDAEKRFGNINVDDIPF